MLHRTAQKRPLNLLKLTQNSAVIQNSNYLLKETRNFIAQILEFDDQSASIKQIAKSFASQDMGCYEVLKLWDKALSLELMKFAARVNSLNVGSKQNSLPNFISGIILKLKKLSRRVIEVVQQIVKIQQLCLCERKLCPSRILPQFTQSRIQQYVARNLNANLLKEQIQLNQIEEIQTFFSSKNDEQCHILSLQKISQNYALFQEKKSFLSMSNSTSQESITSFLKNLKILEKERKFCYSDSAWLEALAFKYSS